MEHVSVWGSVSAVDHRSVAALELMPKDGEVIPLALSRYDTLKKKLETCGGVFGDQADHRAFFPWRMAKKKRITVGFVLKSKSAWDNEPNHFSSCFNSITKLMVLLLLL